MSPRLAACGLACLGLGAGASADAPPHRVYDAQRKQLEWQTVAWPKAGDWQAFSRTVTLKPGAANVMAGLFVKGSGKAWLDDFSVVETAPGPAPAAAPAAAEPAALPVALAASDPRVRYSGRFDLRRPDAPGCAWPASAATVRFRGTALNVRLSDGGRNRFEVFVDGRRAATLALAAGSRRYAVAASLAPGEHTVELVKRTEAFFGTTRFEGFELPEGAEALPAPPPARRLEVIGDSISAGYGNEAASQAERFDAVTENAAAAYGALAARALGAEYHCLAWSGRTMWPSNTLPAIYDRVLPQEGDGPAWDFAAWQPDAVVINLGTNDFAGGNPEEEGWVGAYLAFVARVRERYPRAAIYCALGPMLSDPWSKSKTALSTCRRYLQRVVAERAQAGDANVRFLEFDMQDGKHGFGADWHPSLATHRLMADRLVEALRGDLRWADPAP